MARTKTNTQNDTKTRTTPWRNTHLEKNYIFKDRCDFRTLCIFKVESLHNLSIKLSRYFYFELISSTSVSCGKFYKEKEILGWQELKSDI